MLTLLLVEDDVDIRENLVELIGGLELFTHVWQTALGKEAFRLAVEHHPSIILCDIGLPDISGIEVFRLLKKTPATALIPIIFLTANPTQRDTCMGLGVDDFIDKPCNFNNLVGRLRTVILRYQAIALRAKQEVAASIPTTALINQGMDSIITNARLTILSPDASPDIKELARQSLVRAREVVAIMRSLGKNSSF